jgi:hypothetical protein
LATLRCAPDGGCGGFHHPGFLLPGAPRRGPSPSCYAVRVARSSHPPGHCRPGWRPSRYRHPGFLLPAASRAAPLHAKHACMVNRPCRPVHRHPSTGVLLGRSVCDAACVVAPAPPHHGCLQSLLGRIAPQEMVPLVAAVAPRRAVIAALGPRCSAWPAHWSRHPHEQRQVFRPHPVAPSCVRRRQAPALVQIPCLLTAHTEALGRFWQRDAAFRWGWLRMSHVNYFTGEQGMR